MRQKRGGLRQGGKVRIEWFEERLGLKSVKELLELPPGVIY